MKNRYKFRVYDKKEKRYIYPDSPGQHHFFITLNGEFYNFQNGSGGDDYIVQQWTGYTDSGGKDVYEGDKIGPYSEIEYREGKFVCKLFGARTFDIDEIFGNKD
jgi:asparagine N-glycosylation enzyme membrane subunit Stt3